MNIEPGKIDPGPDAPFGFTADKFDGWLWYLPERNEVMVSFILSKQEGRGNVRSLFDAIEAAGFTVAVPTPFARMREICEKRGYVSQWRDDPQMGPVEVMARPS